MLPISLLLSYLINLAVVFTVVIAIMFIMTPFGSELLWMLPFVILTHGVFLLGVSYFLATANVFVRDVSQIIPLILHLAFFLTPIVYLREILGATGNRGMMWVFKFNPMAYAVELYRWAVVVPSDKRMTLADDSTPEAIKVDRIEFSDILVDWGIFAAFAVVFAILGYKFFMSQKSKFADEI